MTLPPRRLRLLVTLSAFTALLLPTTTGAATAAGAVPTDSVAAMASGVRTFTADTASAASLVDSVGVNTHLHYDDTSYGRFADVVRPRLLELGVRHIRDGAYTYADAGPDSAYYRKLRELSQDGIRFDLITGMQTKWGGPRTDFTKLADVQRWTGDAVESFEGVNEPDLQDVAGWVGEARSVQRELAQTVRGTPSLSGVKVLGPSVTSEEASASLGDISGWVDQANLHNYPSDRHPETRGWGSNAYGSLGWSLSMMAGRVAPRMPVVTTETGYYTSPTDNNGVSEKAASGYTPRLLLNQFAGGVRRTYLYEMMRQRTDPRDPEANFGLVRADGSRTASFLAVRSLIDLLQSTGPAPSPGSPTRLSWQVAGDTSNLRQMPIRLASGEYVLAVWSEDELWDTERNRDVSPAARALEITPAAGLEVTGVVTQAPTGEFREQAVRGRGAAIAVGGRLTFLRLGPDTTPGDQMWVDPALGTTTTRPAADTPTGHARPTVRVKGQGRDRGRDVRAGRGAPRGAPVARTVDLRRATATASGSRVRVRLHTAGRAKLTRRDTLAYTIRAAGQKQPLLRWSNRAGTRVLARPRVGEGRTCAVTARRYAARTMLEVSIPAACLPRGSQVALTASAALRRTTPAGPRWWVDSMRGPSLSVS